jgi:excisionase family DNA binding protein
MSTVRALGSSQRMRNRAARIAAGLPRYLEKKPPVEPPPEALFITVDEAAALLRVGRNAIYSAIQRGELRGVKRIGKVIRINRARLLKADADD